jgi:hypothetical protein
MNDYHAIQEMFPDHINGALNKEEKQMVDNALASSEQLRAEYSAIKEIMSVFDREKVKTMMEEESRFSISKIELSESNGERKIYPIKAFISGATALAACLLLWIGVYHENNNESKSAKFNLQQQTDFAQISYVDDMSELTMSQDELEDIMLEEVLALYVRDIESDNDAPLNPILEDEITKYLLKETQDEESL